MDMGIEPGRYIVGNELNSKNPITGQPEFFLKKIVSQIRKAIPGDLENYLGPLVGLATGNPFLGGLAGAIGSGTQGAIAGGLGGLQSPGIKGLGGKFGRELPGIFGLGTSGKVAPIDLKNITNMEELGKFFLGDKDDKGLFGKFDFRKDVGEEAKKKVEDQIIKDRFGNIISRVPADKIPLDEMEKAVKAKEGVLAGMSIMDAAKLFGLGTVGIGLLIDLTNEQGDIGAQADTMPEGNVLEGILNPVYKASGGVMDLQDGGESIGPGTGTSDSIPAMLSDGEFVMTAKAVRGAGGGDRREGARKMYQAMDRLEAMA